MEYIFLAGIHAVGKSTLLNRINLEYPVYFSSISDLIRKAGKNIPNSEKKTDSILENQKLWRRELNKLFIPEGKKLILDGHFSLLDNRGNVAPLDFSIFKDTEMIKIILKIEQPSIVQKRLFDRDGTFFDIKIIEYFQKVEQEQAYNFSKLNEIPIFLYDNENCFMDAVNFVKL